MGMNFMSKREIKSYVIRSRMTSFQKKNYENSYLDFCIPYQEKYLDFRSLFRKNGDKIIIEIGSGMGEATVEIAKNNINNNYIAIEVYKAGVGKLISELIKNNLDNVKIIEYDAIKVIDSMIPESSIDGVHIFFPDPWPKKRHNKRRLLKEKFLEALASKLKTGGYIYVATDWEDYANEIIDNMSRIKNLKNKFNGFASDIHWRPSTKFEKKGISKAHKIYEIFFEKLEFL
jgi:tRNA (guanine-N7-)-methyltransferase